MAYKNCSNIFTCQNQTAFLSYSFFSEYNCNVVLPVPYVQVTSCGHAVNGSCHLYMWPNSLLLNHLVPTTAPPPTVSSTPGSLRSLAVRWTPHLSQATSQRDICLWGRKKQDAVEQQPLMVANLMAHSIRQTSTRLAYHTYLAATNRDS